MTFELSPEHEAARAGARSFARDAVLPQSAAVDRDASIPADLLRAARDLVTPARDALTLVLTLEEVAAASATVALMAGADVEKAATPLALPGLRGATTLHDSPRTQLVLAAVALGLGRTAVDAGLAVLRAVAPGSDNDKPHWVLADVATELEAARLLTYKAARAAGHAGSDSDIAIARLMATSAAERAVDAGVRIAGPEGYQAGGTLDRVSRDARAVALIVGTEEQQRAKAAEGLLPQ